MHLGQVLALAVGLGADAMSVSAAIGVRWHGHRRALRLAWHMGLFQFGMPLVGWLCGRQLAGVLLRAGRYVGTALLLVIGGKMLIEAWRSRPGSVAESVEHSAERHIRKADPTRGWSLIGLSVAASVDALVAGFSLAVAGNESIWLNALVIGLTAGAMSLVGVAIGRRAGRAFGRAAEFGGALALICVALSFLWL